MMRNSMKTKLLPCLFLSITLFSFLCLIASLFLSLLSPALLFSSFSLFLTSFFSRSCEVWAGTSYALAACMLQEGLVQEAFQTARGVYVSLVTFFFLEKEGFYLEKELKDCESERERKEEIMFLDRSSLLIHQ